MASMCWYRAGKGVLGEQGLCWGFLVLLHRSLTWLEGWSCLYLNMCMWGDMKVMWIWQGHGALIKGWLCKMIRGVRMMVWFSICQVGLLHTIVK